MNKVNEISSKPPSAAKKFKYFLKTPRQIPGPPGGHPVPPGYERVHDVISGGHMLRKKRDVSEKVGMGTMAGAAFGTGVGAALGAPLIGAAAGAFAAHKIGQKLKKTFGAKPTSQKVGQKPRPTTAPRGLREMKSFKDFADEIDFGFTEEEFEVTGDEVYEDWNEVEELEEAEKGGRKVKLGKPFLTPGGPKKRSVYVKHPDSGNVVKVNFGDPNMRIKKSDPERRRSFRARHNCENPGPRHKARYWSCKAW